MESIVVLNPAEHRAAPLRQAPANPPPRLYVLAPMAALATIRALAGHLLGPVGEGLAGEGLFVLEGEPCALAVVGAQIRTVLPAVTVLPGRAIAHARRPLTGDLLFLFLPVPERERRLQVATVLLARLALAGAADVVRRLDLTRGGLVLETVRSVEDRAGSFLRDPGV